MKSETRGLTGVCVASLALMALVMGSGLLGMPSLVMAQRPMGSTCSPAGGVTGCYNCNGGPATSSGQGCNGTTSPPAGWSIGSCNPTSSALTCTAGTIDCGAWINCTTKKATGGNCTTFAVCI